MSEYHAGDSRDQASEAVRLASDHVDSPLSVAQLETMTQALEKDLDAMSDKVRVDEERLAKVEAQTRVLAQAVIAVTDPADAIASAVRAVKDEM